MHLYDPACSCIVLYRPIWSCTALWGHVKCLQWSGRSLYSFEWSCVIMQCLIQFLKVWFSLEWYLAWTFPWSLVLFGPVLAGMILYGPVLSYAVLHGHVRSSMILYCSVMSCMNLSSCVVLYDPVCPCMIFWT